MAAITSLSVSATTLAPDAALPSSKIQSTRTTPKLSVRCSSSSRPHEASLALVQSPSLTRRVALSSAAAGAVLAAWPPAAGAAPKQSLPTDSEESLKLCDDECEGSIEKLPLVTTASGLQYRDIVVGKGPSPPVGFQVAADYVAMVPSGRVFDSSIEKKAPYIFRVGAGQVVPGLDEGILSMSVGGLRRLYIPGSLSFPKGLSSAPGRPRVPPSSPVVFDVKLLYIPGLDLDDEEEGPAAAATEETPAPADAELDAAEV